jgi:hypothetical protein
LFPAAERPLSERRGFCTSVSAIPNPIPTRVIFGSGSQASDIPSDRYSEEEESGLRLIPELSTNPIPTRVIFGNRAADIPSYLNELFSATDRPTDRCSERPTFGRVILGNRLTDRYSERPIFGRRRLTGLL